MRNMLGLAAVGGAYAYARKHGGFQNAFGNLWARRDELIGKAKNMMANQGVGSSVGSGVSDVSGSSIGGSSYGSTSRSSVLDEEPVTYSGGSYTGSNGLNRR
ncbi:MAG TPA: hypothetical protein VFQ53_28645 [Kofleriaceae bacterium]|nr:hypothetical protein [Kofleriaceae bacterium]